MTLILLKEVQKRTGYSPSALKTRRCRGDHLPFPLYKGDDGLLRADEDEVEEWCKKIKNQNGEKR